MKKKVPKFEHETEERKFWQENDSSDYLDWSDAEDVVFSNLKPSTRKISIRLPESMIEDLKLLAKKDEFDELLMKARQEGKKVGLKKADITEAIKKIRGKQ